MNTVLAGEAQILLSNNILLLFSEPPDDVFVESFCGEVHRLDELTETLPDLSQRTVFLYGNLSEIEGVRNQLAGASRVCVIRGAVTRQWIDSENRQQGWGVVDVGQVPMLVHGVGVYYRQFFCPNGDYFRRIQSEHEFQSLTESNKPGTAHRTGTYLTPVERLEDGYRFRLLRGYGIARHPGAHQLQQQRSRSPVPQPWCPGHLAGG